GEHRAEHDRGDGEGEHDPEQPAELRDVVPVAGVAAMAAMAFVAFVALMVPVLFVLAVAFVVGGLCGRTLLVFGASHQLSFPAATRSTVYPWRVFRPWSDEAPLRPWRGHLQARGRPGSQPPGAFSPRNRRSQQVGLLSGGYSLSRFSTC